ncbi:MAG: hypothetical protein HOO96_14055 [Polyangiaceae bacterium]|nr:hypothetical protein [Polyangiaceae bacterium]
MSEDHKVETEHVSSTWNLIAQIPRPTSEVPAPRETGTLLVRELVMEEVQSCVAATATYMHVKVGRTKHVGATDDLYNNEAATQILSRAFLETRDDGPPVPAFPSPKAVRATLQVQEVGALMSAYLEHASTHSCIRATMTDAEMVAMVEKLATGGTQTPLAFLTPGATEDFVRWMAEKLHPHLPPEHEEEEEPEPIDPETL